MNKKFSVNAQDRDLTKIQENIQNNNRDAK